MKRQIMLLSAVCMALAAFSDPNDPQVALVSAVQDYERVLTIRYTLDEPAIVTFDVKTNGVSIGAEHLKTACGDLHRVVAATGEAVVPCLVYYFLQMMVDSVIAAKMGYSARKKGDQAPAGA